MPRRPSSLVAAIPAAADRYERTFRIAANASTTQEVTDGVAGAEVDLDGLVPIALWTPAAWTAAAITFQVSRDGSNFADLFDTTGAEVTIPAASIPTAAARRFALDPVLFLGIVALRIRSGTTASAVTQAAQRDLIVVLRAI